MFSDVKYNHSDQMRREDQGIDSSKAFGTFFFFGILGDTSCLTFVTIVFTLEQSNGESK